MHAHIRNSVTVQIDMKEDSLDKFKPDWGKQIILFHWVFFIGFHPKVC